MAGSEKVVDLDYVSGRMFERLIRRRVLRVERDTRHLYLKLTSCGIPVEKKRDGKYTVLVLKRDLRLLNRRIRRFFTVRYVVK